ncbi:269_t:CDS:2, partial [Gigaspora rosea]
MSLGQLETVSFNVESHFKEKTDTENIFTIKLIIVTKQKFENYGETSESAAQRSPSVERLSELNMEFRFVQNLVGTFNGSFEFGDSIDFKTPFVIKLDLPIANDDTTPTNNTKPIPLRYLSKKIEDADPRTLLKIGMIRTDNSLITRKIISFLQEFEMKFNIITPNDIPLCDINVLIFDSAEADNEMIETICRNVRNTRILIISITLLLRHLIICETAQKVGLEDNDIFFVAK